MQILFEISLYGRVARKKPYVNKINRGKRIAYAKMMMEKPYDMFFHQMSLNLIYSDLMVRLWCGDLRWRSIILSALCQQ